MEKIQMTKRQFLSTIQELSRLEIIEKLSLLEKDNKSHLMPYMHDRYSNGVYVLSFLDGTFLFPHESHFQDVFFFQLVPVMIPYIQEADCDIKEILEFFDFLISSENRFQLDPIDQFKKKIKKDPSGVLSSYDSKQKKEIFFNKEMVTVVRLLDGFCYADKKNNFQFVPYYKTAVLNEMIREHQKYLEALDYMYKKVRLRALFE